MSGPIALISQRFTEADPVWLVMAGFLAALFLVGVIVLVVFMLRRRRSVRELSLLSAQYAEERVKAEAIISGLDIGLIAYGRDGRLTLSNPAAQSLLNLSAAIPDFDSFMTRFAEDNGVRTRFILGKGDAEGTLTIDGRIIRMNVSETRTQTQGRVASIVTLQDITEAERQETQRKAFVANVSHELKTPLTTIITYAESLLDWGLEEKQPDALRRDIVRIHDDAIRMESLVTDLLLLSSIDSRKLYSRMELLDLDGLTKQVVERMRVQADEKEITLDPNTHASPLPKVFGDRSSIERVLQNVLSNAIKYSDPRSTVGVHLNRLDDQVYIKVSDSGFGIEAQHIPLIFDRFYRVDLTGSRVYGGTGLGLSIVKELVDLHHGQIDVQSTLGKGSTFTIMLPHADKAVRDVLTALRQGLMPDDSLDDAVEIEILSRADEHGWVVDAIQDLDEEQIDILLGEAHDVQTDLPDIMDETSSDIPSADLGDAQDERDGHDIHEADATDVAGEQPEAAPKGV